MTGTDAEVPLSNSVSTLMGIGRNKATTLKTLIDTKDGSRVQSGNKTSMHGRARDG